MSTQTATQVRKCRTILLIEDNNEVRTAFELILDHHGYDALVVSTAEEGLLAVQEYAYDIIICDYRLPGMDGLDFYYQARPYTPGSTKVLISAFGFDDILTKAKALGVDQFYEKPFSIMTVLSRINKRSNRRFINLSIVEGGR